MPDSKLVKCTGICHVVTFLHVFWILYPDNMILLGSVQRTELERMIEEQLNKAHQQEFLDSVREMQTSQAEADTARDAAGKQSSPVQDSDRVGQDNS